MVKLVVEQASTLYGCCDALLTAQDIASASRYQNERRRAEHLAWRRIVRRELGREVNIDYDAVGAPVVDTPNIYISVSHAAGMVAVAFSDRRVGVDIEQTERHFERVASRYISEREAKLSEERWWAAALWSAKEAMYKYYGERGIELLGDLMVESYDATTKRLRGTLAARESVEVEISLLDDKFVVAVAHPV